MSTLYIMVGPPASGKSTWAAKHCNNAYVVSRDNIRFELLKPNEPYFCHENAVWEKYVAAIKDFLQHGKDVIADATHNDHFSRNKLFRALKNIECNIVLIVMGTSKEECLNRNYKRKGVQHVPNNVIEDFYKSFEYPEKSEDPRITTIYCYRSGNDE